MRLNDCDINKLFMYWDNYFGVNIDIKKIDNNTRNGSIDILFNWYLSNVSQLYNYDFNLDICFCEKSKFSYNIFYIVDDKLEKIEFGFKAKRKFYNFLSSFNTIITNGFPLSKNTLSENKEILRYEIVRNILTSNHTHFFSKSLPFSIDDKTVFFTTEFYSIIKNETQYDNILFSSFLLNEFELGVTIDDIVLKPCITVSPYGRWYWSGTEKVQNDIKAREKIYHKFIKYGKIINLDLTSGEPTILSELSNSKFLKKLIKCRILLNEKGDIELSGILKDILNIFIHSLDTPKEAYNKFKYKNPNYLDIEKKLKTSVFDIFSCLQNEFLCYNNYILNDYKNNLSVTECNRRIVNPGNILLSDIELLKEHRKFLQGLTHDKIINIARLIYDKIGLLPIFTIHDSLSYFIDNKNDAYIDVINSIAKTFKTPLTIEIIETEKGEPME